MKNKKVAVLYSGARDWGGIETYLNNLLSNKKNNNIDFYLLSMGKWELSDKLSKGALKDRVIIISKARVNPILFFKVKKILKQNGIDVIMSQGVVANSYAKVISLLSGVPHLCVVHSDLSGEYNNIFLNKLYLLSDWTLRGVTKRYICVSNYLKEVLVSRGIKSDKIKVIYNGVKVEGDYIRKKKQEKIIIGSIGRLSNEKGYDILIQAAKEIDNNIEIRICGAGKERSALEALIEKNNLKDKVKLVGFCEDPIKFILGLDLYIQPSRSEGFGLSVVESMMVGVPVIVSSRGALPELVSGFDNRIVLEDITPGSLATRIKWAIENINDLNKEFSEGRSVIEKKFGYERWYDETIESVAEVAK